MQENVQKTIDDILAIIGHWKTFWLKQYEDDGINEWILEEFCELIFGGEYYQFGIVASAVDRMKQQKFISEGEYDEFWAKVYAEVDDMRRQLRLSEPEQKIIAFPE